MQQILVKPKLPLHLTGDEVFELKTLITSYTSFTFCISLPKFDRHRFVDVHSNLKSEVEPLFRTLLAGVEKIATCRSLTENLMKYLYYPLYIFLEVSIDKI